MKNDESERHHFVPEFLMSPWCGLNGLMYAYSWNRYKSQVSVKERSAKSVCFQMGLLSLSGHPAGRDAIERDFFGPIDTAGALVRIKIIASGTASLTDEERSAFAHLLFSLEVRRPKTIEAVRAHSDKMREGLDCDPKILAEMARLGVGGTPSELWMKGTGATLEDHMLTLVQAMVSPKRVGRVFVNAKWGLIHLGPVNSFLEIVR